MIRAVFVVLLASILALQVEGQKIPDTFWDASLAGSGLYLGLAKDIAVKRIFRDQPFRSYPQLDGTTVTSKIQTTKLAGNDVTIDILSYRGKDLIYRVKWRFSFRSAQQDVVIAGIEGFDSTSDEHFSMDAFDYESSGALYKTFVTTIAEMLLFYFDYEELVRGEERRNG